MNEQLKNKLAFIIEIDKFKSVERRTRLVDNSRRETDAEHSWHVAMIADVLYDYAAEKENIDISRVIKMLLIHDLVEIYAGDTFAFDEKGYLDKLERESEAAKKIFSLLPTLQSTEYHTLWVEFDEIKTHDARYAAAIDRLQPFINNYLTDGCTWREGEVRLDQVMKRIGILKETLPDLWEFVEYAIDKAIKENQIKP